MVSSAHANVKEFHRTGAVPKLHRIARECLQLLEEQEESSSSSSQDLLCESLVALRTMAIGCLAIRNIASRLARMSYDEDKTKLLDAGAEDILQNIAGKHPASAEEAYAALRDLGCNPQMFQMDEYGNTIKSKTEIFGEVKSAFRPVYE